MNQGGLQYDSPFDFFFRLTRPANRIVEIVSMSAPFVLATLRGDALVPITPTVKFTMSGIIRLEVPTFVVQTTSSTQTPTRGRSNCGLRCITRLSRLGRSKCGRARQPHRGRTRI